MTSKFAFCQIRQFCHDWKQPETTESTSFWGWKYKYCIQMIKMFDLSFDIACSIHSVETVHMQKIYLLPLRALFQWLTKGSSAPLTCFKQAGGETWHQNCSGGQVYTGLPGQVTKMWQLPFVESGIPGQSNVKCYILTLVKDVHAP